MQKIYCLFLRACLPIVFLLTASPVVVAQFVYQIDDGSFGAGNGFAGVNVYGNMFEVNGSATDIFEVQFVFGNSSIIGESIPWIVFGDDDGNPQNGLVFLQQGTHIIENGSLLNSTFESAKVSVDVSGFEWFFVTAAYIPASLNQLVTSIVGDPSNPQNQSWRSLSANQTGNIFDWSNSSISGINYAIRAVASSKPLLGDIDGNGIVDLLDVAPFVSLLDNNTYQVEADINSDGVVNLVDLLNL